MFTAVNEGIDDDQEMGLSDNRAAWDANVQTSLVGVAALALNQLTLSDDSTTPIDRYRSPAEIFATDEWSTKWHNIPYDVLDTVFMYLNLACGSPQHIACIKPCWSARAAKAMYEGRVIWPVIVQEVNRTLSCQPHLENLMVTLLTSSLLRGYIPEERKVPDLSLSIEIDDLRLLGITGTEQPPVPASMLEQGLVLATFGDRFACSFNFFQPGMIYRKLGRLVICNCRIIGTEPAFHEDLYFPVLQEVVIELDDTMPATLNEARFEVTWWPAFFSRTNKNNALDVKVHCGERLLALPAISSFLAQLQATR